MRHLVVASYTSICNDSLNITLLMQQLLSHSPAMSVAPGHSQTSILFVQTCSVAGCHQQHHWDLAVPQAKDLIPTISQLLCYYGNCSNTQLKGGCNTTYINKQFQYNQLCGLSKYVTRIYGFPTPHHINQQQKYLPLHLFIIPHYWSWVVAIKCTQPLGSIHSPT